MNWKHLTILAACTSSLAACQKSGQADVSTSADASLESSEPNPKAQTSASASADMESESNADENKVEGNTSNQGAPGLYATTVNAVEVDCGNVAVYFETESAELQDTARDTLKQVAECISGTRAKEDIQITGAADPRGTEEFNKELSERRAKTVADYLKEQGVQASSFQVTARGEEGMIEGEPELWHTQRRAVIETED